ncbi:MAG: AmmeMemoRadiSam system protein A [Mariprofundaceae bacterium]
MNEKSNRGPVLIALARNAIADELGLDAKPPSLEGLSWLQADAATFVTLTKQGDLRGCIGTLEACRPLIDDLRANAVAAAFHDPRFSPLKKSEFDEVRVEVSVLSELEPMHAKSEAIACSKLVPHRDGLVFKYGSHKATFLPQVWDQLPDAQTFLAHLKQKAGLAADFWHPEVLLYRYQVSKYRERAEPDTE